MRTDVHQHLLGEPLIAALARRSEPPHVHMGPGGSLTLHLAGEAPSRVKVDQPDDRAALLAGDGVDRGIVALSAALGIESLPADDAEELIGAYVATALALPEVFRAWGTIPLADPDQRRVDRLLDEGFAGLCVPAGALADPAAIDRLGPVLEALERRGAPLFVHPGPPAAASPGAPSWWPAATDYVAGLHAAWCAWLARGRYSHPTLRVLFAALAGLAPLHAERLASRGAPSAAHDAYLFYDTSSYGPTAIAAMRAAAGPGQIVYGSDRPVVVPTPPGDQALTVHNPARLFA
jgi:predicted TIM-barrel fold metal-dependent hydrolase